MKKSDYIRKKESYCIQDVLSRIPLSSMDRLIAPAFEFTENDSKAVLGVASMVDHMTDEGFQITKGLSLNGYVHCGHGLDLSLTSIDEIIKEVHPGTLVLQDIREWDVDPRDFRDGKARFTEVENLKDHPNIFRLTILKDSQQRPEYHQKAAEDMGCHAWIVYYHPHIVQSLATYVRPEHLIRTYHSIDPSIVPSFKMNRNKGCLLSGAISRAYPLRSRILSFSKLLQIQVLRHPGYHRLGCHTPRFLEILSDYKVHICTSSRYGYALRKLIESSVMGCRVITDLPTDEILPEIDENFIRIHPDISIDKLKEVIVSSIDSYDAEKQKEISERALKFYDFVNVTRRLSEDIDLLRKSYNG